MNKKELNEKTKEKIKEKSVAKKNNDVNRSLKEKIKTKTKSLITRKNPRFIAYLIDESHTTRVKVYETHKKFFEYKDQHYYINYEKIVRNFPREKTPVLLFRKNYIEPIEPTNNNLELIISKDLNQTIEGDIIEQFKASNINIDQLEKYLKISFLVSGITLIVVVYNLLTNIGVIGG